MDAWKLEPSHDHGLSLSQRARSVRREAGLVESLSRLSCSAVISIYLRVYHRLSIQGREHLPRAGPFVMVANHASHLDALVLTAAVPLRLRDQLFPIAAGDTFFKTPLTGLAATVLINALPMWRRNAGAHALADLRERLVEQRCAFLLFPEGTRTRDGQMGMFKAGLGMLVAGTAVPVVPCRLSGTFEALPADRRWPRPAKVRLRIGRPMVFEQVANDREGWMKIAAESRDAVKALGEM